MPAKIYRDQDADLGLLSGKTIGVLGYGSQGHAQAQNLRQSGCRVVVAELPGTANYRRAVEDGFQPVSTAEATRQADLIAILLPDELQAEVFRNDIRPNLSPGDVLVCAHGFNVRFGQFDVPEGVSTALVAPLGPGSLVRAEYLRGSGVPCLVAVADGAGPDTLNVALAYAKAIGATRVGAVETTFAEETETDLFAEQAITCGGLSALVKAGFETLVEAGYQPEIAYFVCVHEVRQIVDLVCRGGLSHMRQCISNTAEYGDYTRGPRIVTAETKAEMKRILAEIRDGRFADEWLKEAASCRSPAVEKRHDAASTKASFQAMRQAQQADPMEETGRRVRELIGGAGDQSLAK
jgi:ketol-acid reductoisomerase